jgi:hypothetical protein
MKTSRKQIAAEAARYRRMEIGAIENAEAQEKAGFPSNGILCRVDSYHFGVEAARLESMVKGK